jgi:general secretion pathway protein K
MVAVAVLTALAADLAYESQVSLRIAANARNELQATYLAKSGIALSRLVLAFQAEVDEAAGGTTAIAGAPAMPRPQLWKIAPVDSDLAAALFGGPARSRPEAATALAALTGTPAAGPQPYPPAVPATPAAPAAPAPPTAGSFEVDIQDEGQKVNAQLEGTDTGQLPAQVQAFWQLICDPKWDPLFDREDANGVRTSRADLLVNLRDWVDPDSVTSAIAASFAPSGCAIALPPKPFEPGFGDENALYDRGDVQDRYRTKNARMDSLDELYLVSGIGDAFMAAFGDQLTVYLKRDTLANANALDLFPLQRNAALMATNHADPKLQDLKFLLELQKAAQLRTMFGFFALTAKDLSEIVGGLGVSVNPNAVGGTTPLFTDKSTVFRLRAQGRAGDVTKTLDVILRPDKIQPTKPIPGQIVHWREE